MPRYYFHVFNGNGETHDDEGVELDDLDSAREQAVVGIRSILRDELNSGSIDLDGMIAVSDASNNVLLEVRFDDALEIRRSKSA